MANPIRTGIVILIALVLGTLVLKFLVGVVSTLISLIVPLAVVGAIGLIIYGLINRKSLRGGGRYLP
jgi:hypothetical protein